MCAALVAGCILLRDAAQRAWPDGDRLSALYYAVTKLSNIWMLPVTNNSSPLAMNTSNPPQTP